MKMTPACVHDRTYIDKVLIAKTRKNPLARITACLCKVCVYYCRTYYKAVRGGGRRREEDMCYEIFFSVNLGHERAPFRAIETMG